MAWHSGLTLGKLSAAREETREVLSYPSVVTRVPGAKPWIRGIANVRGQLLPVVDLRAYPGGGMTNTNRSTRVLVAKHREVPAGLLVDEVLGFRRFADGDFSATPPPTIVRCESLSRRCVPSWHGELAGVRLRSAAGERRVFAGSGLLAAQRRADEEFLSVWPIRQTGRVGKTVAQNN